MKLIDLLKEEYEPKGYKSRITKIDPETNSITWSIKPNDLKVLDKKLEQVVDALESFSRRPDDPKIDKFLETFKKFKKAFRSHITRNYK